VDVNKKLFRLFEIPYFVKRNPACFDRFEEVQRSATACFDEFCGAFTAGIDAIERRQWLRAAIRLSGDNCLMVQPQWCKEREQFSGDKGQVTGNNDGPLAPAGTESCMETTERAPLRIDVRNTRKH